MDIEVFATEFDAQLQKLRNGTAHQNQPPRYSQDFVFPIEGSQPHGILFDDESEEMIADGPFACGKTFYSTMKLHRRALVCAGRICDCAESQGDDQAERMQNVRKGYRLRSDDNEKGIYQRERRSEPAILSLSEW